MLRILALSLALGCSGAAFAKADCTAHPKSEWMKESDAKAQIESQGYKIRKFKVDDNFYEIYGHDKDAKRSRSITTPRHTKTLAVVKSEVE